MCLLDLDVTGVRFCIRTRFLVCFRVRAGDQDVGERQTGGHVLRWRQAALSHQGEAPKKGDLTARLMFLTPCVTNNVQLCSGEPAETGRCDLFIGDVPQTLEMGRKSPDNIQNMM